MPSDAVIDYVTRSNSERPTKCQKLIVATTRSSAVDGIRLTSINAWLPGSWAAVPIADKAVKSDDARIDTQPWHKRISLALPCRSRTLSVLERFATRWWRRSIILSFFEYLRREYGSDWLLQLSQSGPNDLAEREPAGSKRTFGRAFAANSSIKGGTSNNSALTLDLVKGLAVIGQVLQSSWWEWTNGSSLLFWRWNGREQSLAARDGMHIHTKGSLAKMKRRKAMRFEPSVKALVGGKIQTMLDRSYLETGSVLSLLHYFAVPKGDSDIRVVYDGTFSGLNDSLWAPNFFLPSARHAGELLNFDSWLSDMDFGEFFHNFHMNERIRKHSGVDVGFLKLHAPSWRNYDPKTQLRWSSLFMGSRPSPYNAVRHYYWAEEFAKGNPSESNNPMGLDSVILNLPGMVTYDPHQPKVMKWDSINKCITGDVITFVDNVRITGSSKERCWSVHRQFASQMQYLGLQDAPRKFRPPSQNQAGAWTGTIFRVDSGSVSKTVSQEKWSNGRDILARMQKSLETCDCPDLDRKEFEKQTGFLNHLAMTFEEFNPFLKGCYLTLNSWRSGRDQDGWKIPDKGWSRALFSRFEDDLISREELNTALNQADDGSAPKTVKACSRFKSDVSAMAQLLSPAIPPVVNIRSKSIVTVAYGFGDASRLGLGATFTRDSGFAYRIGIWGTDDTNQSSNWKEFCNIVTALEDEAKEGNLANSEVFMFTDNSTVESCCIRGTSSSPKLLSLVVQLWSLTTRYSLKINIFHVSGTRMIAQEGTDGVSRGFLGGGVMAGAAMTSFIPIHLGAVERHPPALDWIRSWSTTELIHLDPMGWFEKGHDIEGWRRCYDGFSRPVLKEQRVYLWTPPPYAADVAVAEMRKARIKRQSSTHIFICPRLCSSVWLRQLHKAADFVFEVPAGRAVWPHSLHEPLLIGILFPFIRSCPWQLWNTPKLYAMGGLLRRMFKEEEVDPRDILRQFWGDCHRLRNMPENVVRRVLYLRASP